MQQFSIITPIFSLFFEKGDPVRLNSLLNQSRLNKIGCYAAQRSPFISTMRKNIELIGCVKDSYQQLVNSHDHCADHLTINSSGYKNIWI